MCHIFVKRKGVLTLPSNEEIKRKFSSNPDGAGIALSAEDGTEVHWAKGIMRLDELIKKVELLRELPLEKYAIAIHLRLSTIGGRQPRLCHPFPVGIGDDLYPLVGESTDGVMMHNGILDDWLWKKKVTNFEGGSDTTAFITQILPHVSDDLRELNGAIGGNKLVFILPKAETVIINSDYGQWKDGIWNSNKY